MKRVIIWGSDEGSYLRKPESLTAFLIFIFNSALFALFSVA